MRSRGLLVRLGCSAAVVGAVIVLHGCGQKEDPSIFPPNVDTSHAVKDTDAAAATNGFDDGTGQIKAKKAPARKH